MKESQTERGLPRSLDCKTVVFFANASDGPYSNERSGASVKTARENGERRKKIRLSAMFSRLTRPAGKWGSRASHSRITLTALRAFRKRSKTTVLQSMRSSNFGLLSQFDKLRIPKAKDIRHRHNWQLFPLLHLFNYGFKSTKIYRSLRIFPVNKFK